MGKHDYLRTVDPRPIAIAERTAPPADASERQTALDTERRERIIEAILMARRIEHDRDLVGPLAVAVNSAEMFGEPLDPNRLLMLIERFGRGDTEFLNQLAAVQAICHAFGRDRR